MNWKPIALTAAIAFGMIVLTFRIGALRKVATGA